MMSDLETYLKERDEVLVSGDVDRLIALAAKCNMPLPTTRHSAEIAMHKMRTAVTSLPMQARIDSKRWLSKHGYQPLDDGDVPLEQ